MQWQKLYSTFVNCPSLPPPLTKSLLAKAGLQYDNRKRSVVCSKCAWSTAQLHTLTEHILQCPHVAETEPSHYQEPTMPRSVPSAAVPQACGLSSDFTIPDGHSAATATAENSHGGIRSIGNQPLHREINPYTDGLAADGLVEHGFAADGSASEAHYTDPVIRRRTFQERGWPANAPVPIDDLVDAGFYYIGPGDRVRCAYCRKKIHQWEAGDDAALEHRRISPFCRFAQMLRH